MKLSEELQWRGFVNQTTLKNITDLDKEPIKFYWGVDPSASSMTVGNLATAMMVRHFIDYGHKAVLLIGGATGLIGDPDGKSEERKLKTEAEIDSFKVNIVKQYKILFAGDKFELVDNLDWFKGLNYIDFLRNVGKHMPMRQMMSREFVQTRLKEDGSGISYAEFSYALIQGYDFLHLFKENSVTMQVCGSDQWGNCIAGVDLIRRVTGKEAHIWSAPLVLNKTTGLKFGKSEEGAIWLDEKLTTVYQFYQFWLNLDDEGIEEYLKIYTLITKEELKKLLSKFNDDRSSRIAQKYLAFEVTKIVHGIDRAKSVRRISEVLFDGREYSELTSEDFNLLANELGLYSSKRGVELAEILVTSKLASSKTEARHFLEDNAVYINGSQIPLSKTTLDKDDIINGYVILRRGKNSQVIVKLD